MVRVDATSSITEYCLIACEVMQKAIHSETPMQGKQQLATLVPMHCKEVKGILDRQEEIKKGIQAIKVLIKSDVDETVAGLAKGLKGLMDYREGIEESKHLAKECTQLENDGKVLDEVRALIEKIERIVMFCDLPPHSKKINAVFDLIKEDFRRAVKHIRESDDVLLSIVSGLVINSEVFSEGLMKL